MEGEREVTGIYMVEESGEGRCPGALPDSGGTIPGEANTGKVITRRKSGLSNQITALFL